MNLSHPEAGIRRIRVVDKLEETTPAQYMGLPSDESVKDQPFMSTEDLRQLDL